MAGNHPMKLTMLQMNNLIRSRILGFDIRFIYVDLERC